MHVVIRLPKRNSGAAVLEAFRNTLPIETSSSVKWVASGFTTPEGVFEKDRGFVQKCGYYATPSFKVKRGRIMSRLFGAKPERWETSQNRALELKCYGGLEYTKFESQITLFPLIPSDHYAEVVMQAYRLYSIGEFDRVAVDYGEEAFAPVRRVYDAIIPEFLSKLS